MDNIMLFLVALSLSTNFAALLGQLIFTSLTMPNKDHPAPSSASSSSSSQMYPQHMLNYYHHPYYHLALNDSEAMPDEQRLMAQLLRNYDPSARPVYNASNTVSVAFGIALTQLSDMVGSLVSAVTAHSLRSRSSIYSLVDNGGRSCAANERRGRSNRRRQYLVFVSLILLRERTS